MGPSALVRFPALPLHICSRDLCPPWVILNQRIMLVHKGGKCVVVCVKGSLIFREGIPNTLGGYAVVDSLILLQT